MLEVDVEQQLKKYLLNKGYVESCIINEYRYKNKVVDIAIVDNENNPIEFYEVKRSTQDILRATSQLRNIIGTLENIKGYAVAFDDKGELYVDEVTPKISAFRTFFSYLEKISIAPDEELFFRGHSDISYLLKPSIYRALPHSETLAVEKEKELYKETIRRCSDSFKDCHSTFEHLVKMQHYQLPTRLLDITANPLVALYFACCHKFDTDGEVYIFKVKKNELKFYDSDAISVVANLARHPFDFTIPKYDDSTPNYIEIFNANVEIKYLLHEIKYEKPHFLDVINPEDLSQVFCVLPKLDNPRIIRQAGVFFLYGIDQEKKKPAKLKIQPLRITINKAGKRSILKDLSLLGIDESTLFPELDKVTDYLVNKH